MKVLVTGGSGFIGSYVVENLLRRGIQVTVFDHVRRPHEVKSNFDSFLGDTRDFVAVSEAVAVHDGVIHLAGVLGTQETIKEPQPAVETNIIGGLNVFKACWNYDKPCVYIAVGNHWMNNSYSISKTTTERFAFMFNREHKTRIAVVRALNAYGPRQKAVPVKKIMPNLVIPALQDKEITIYGDGQQVMDIIYVGDVAEVLVRALLVDHKVYNSVFEAGTGRRTTVNEIAHLVMKYAGGGRIKHVPMRPGEPENSTVVGNSETLKPLGDVQLMVAEEGIERTVAWYKEHLKDYV